MTVDPRHDDPTTAPDPSRRRYAGDPRPLPARRYAEPPVIDLEDFLSTYEIAVTTSTDPALDGLIPAAPAHRGGPSRRPGRPPVREPRQHDRHDHPLNARRGTLRTVPSTPEHVAGLGAHALQRGPRVAAPTDAGEDLRRAGVPEISADDPVFYRRPIDTFDAEGYFVSRQVRPLTARTLTSLFVRVRREAGSVGPSVTASSIRHLSARLVHQAARADATRVTGLDGGSDESRRLLETTWLAAVKRSLFTAHE